VRTRRGIAARATRSAMCARSYSCDPLRERLAQHFKYGPPARRPCIPEEPAVVCPRHLTRYGKVPATDQLHV
jgi:hypothetical protein